MPNNDYANEPNQSRSEEIIQSILDNTEYDEAARSRIEYLLIELKNAIEGGGGGGVTSYSPLTEKPKIDNHTLQAGNNTSSDLGLQTKIDPEHKLSADNVDDTNSTNKFNVKSDWNAASGATAEILNKPTLGTASAKNVPASGDAATGEVVLGSDTRLTDARNAKDVYNWAKQANKPSYNYSEIQNPPTIPDELSDLADDSTHRTVTDTEKDTWNGKQNALTFDDTPTSNSNNPVKSGGVYTALSGKQNNLSEAQMAAANSGATADKINKIAVNENNILSLNNYGGGRNLINISAIKSLNTTGTWSGNKYTATTGIEFTVNKDNSITVNGTSSGAATTFMLTSHGAADTDLSANTYKLSGCEGGSSTTYDLRFYRNSDGTNITNYNGDTDLAYTSGAYNVSILVRAGQTLTTKVFKPMLRLSSDESNLYQPYALSNAELTAKEQTNENNILSSLEANGKKQLLRFHDDTNGALVATAQSNGYSVLITGGDDNVGKTVTYADCIIDKTGTYTFACNLTGTGASCYIYDATTGTQVREYYATNSETLTLTGGHTYQIRTYRKGSGTNATVEAMICDSALYSISSNMRPYSMSNAELTAAIQAIQAQLANS